MLRTLCDLIEPAGFPSKPMSKGLALRRVIVGAGRTMVPFRRNSIVLLPNLELDGEILLLCPGTVADLVGRTLRTRQPAIVLSGSLENVRRRFGVDAEHKFCLRITSSGLALLFGRKCGKAVAVHAALTQDRRRLIHQLSVGTAMGVEALPEYVPAIVEKGEDQIATERVIGRALMPWGKPEKDLQTAIWSAFKPLRNLHSQRNLLGTPDSDYIRLLGRFAQDHPYRTELTMALQTLEHWDRSGLGSVTVHGDYWLNNILGSPNEVTGILDWDRARRNGSPAFDALHLGFMSYAMWAGKYVSELLASIWTDKWEYPWLAQYTKRVGETFAMSASQLQSTAALLWLSYFYYAADVEPPVAWYGRMIDPVCRAFSAIRTASQAGTSIG